MTAPSFDFAPAVKKALKARVALDGPSGSGKTWTALTTAEALADGGRIALLDTERQSASLYADQFSFHTTKMTSFHPEHLTVWLAQAGAHGFDVVVIDSLSHFWEGTDGMLEQVDNFARRNSGGNTFGGWKDARPVERRMIDALLGYPGHVIATMRTKTEWIIEENERGKKFPRRVGMKAVQRDGIEYEFTVCGDLDLDHNLLITKSRCPELADKNLRKPGPEFGKALLGWLNDGEHADNAVDYAKRAQAETATYEEIRAIYAAADAAGLLGAAVQDEEGHSGSLGDLITFLGRAAKQREDKPAEDAPAAAA